MYARFSILPIAALAAVVAAAPNALDARNDSSECNTGSLQCCTSTQTSTPATLTELGGLLGLVLPTIDGLIGLGCTPITVIGTGSGASCTQQPVCCTDNSFNGVINLGCSPVNLGL
ncbi:fungal hydrophobin [Imleria badia]|nr:fungal hydrophobin [Imleria badia]